MYANMIMMYTYRNLSLVSCGLIWLCWVQEWLKCTRSYKYVK